MDTVMEHEVQVADLEKRTLELMIKQIRSEAKGINSYELVDPSGADLPPFDAGAHIDVHLGNGVIRQYSLCNPCSDHKRYVIAVLKDEAGRGGSKALHETFQAANLVKVSRPRNHFPLAGDSDRVILLAGGIGVTPIKAMAHELEARGADFEMHYCARDANCAAFKDEFTELRDRGRLHYHFDNGNPKSGLDIARLLATPTLGTHVYYCGPAGFMKACAEATSHWPKGKVHFEHFKAPDKPAAPQPTSEGGEADNSTGSFDVRLASSGRTISVGPDQSIAEALGEAGVLVETSCCAGLCATCKVRYLEGEVMHNDYILGDEEKSEYLTLCVSRASSKLLVLDL